MVIRVGINGFGRIGRVTFRTCFQNTEIQVTAINDPAIDIEYICYLIKFDSTHGKFKGNITHTDDEIIINDHNIKVFQEKLPPDVPWHRAGVQYVIEASGMFTCLDKASGHLTSEGVKRVIVTAPSVDVPMVIMGVNDYILNTDHKVISCTSSTLYCLAPIIKVLNDHFGVVEGFITSIHAMTPSLKPLDGLCLRGKHWRDYRSINQNIIPATTGACKALGKILPQVKDKMTGLAFRVPVINVSVLDITIKLDTNTSKEDIIKFVEKASRRDLKNIIRISNENAVSSDFIGDSHSCILDVESSLQLRPDFYKIICWYENEYSYACRVVDAIFFSEIQFSQSNMLSSRMTYVENLPKQIMAPTQYSNKKIPMQCNCVTQGTNEFFYINSKESIKTKSTPNPRALLARKPLSSQSSSTAHIIQNRDTKKKNAIFKVWNNDSDSPKNSIRQNRGSFFHSCVTFGPEHSPAQTDSMKVQERLESVKREFSKMLIITEDLLKKSCPSKNKSQCLGYKDIKQGDLNVEVKVESSQEVQKICNRNYIDTKTLNPIVKDCGDFQNKGTVYDRITRKNNEIEVCDFIGTENVKFLTDVENKRIVYDPSRKPKALEMTSSVEPHREKCILKENLDILERNDTSSVISTNTQGPAQFYNNENPAINNNDINPNVVKAIKSLTYAITNKLVENVFNELNAPVPLISKSSENKQLHNNSLEPEEDALTSKYKNDTQKLEDKLPIDTDKTEHYYIKDITKYLQNSNHDLHIIDEELKKRNIILMSSGSNINILNIDSELSAVNTDADRKNFDLNKKILAGLRIVADISPCGSPANTATTISNGDRNRAKDDLYDKLDSASTSDSNNSFQINERKSQVLNLTDLTNSLEDLSRLDKICRIIEISDELSDQLFSSLDNTEISLEQEKKWSFKDLCERLQLDEFCNNVFGKTSY